MRAAPIRTGKPKMARAPASMTLGVNAGHRGDTGATRSGSVIARAGVVGVDARSFPQGVLQLLDQSCHTASGAQ